MGMKRKISDIVLKSLIWLFAGITTAFLVWMVLDIVVQGIGGLSPEFLFSNYNLYKGQTGIFPMIVGTLLIIFTTLFIAAPVGIFAAIFLTEYAKPGRMLSLIRFATESLSGIPSIIYGLFGYIFFKDVLGLGFSVLSASLTLGIMILPVMVRTTEEALKSVPNGYREGSLALGASRLRTIFRVVLPSAIPGILTAVILSMGRVIGETAAVIFTAGSVAKVPAIGHLFDSSVRTLSVHLYMVALEEADFKSAFATATVLMVLITTLNFLAGRFAKRMMKKQTA